MQYITNFIFYLSTDAGLAKGSIDNYRKDVERFLSSDKTPSDLSAIEPSHIRIFLQELADEGKKRSTITKMLCSLKAFFNYLVDHEKHLGITVAPTAAVKCAKREKSLPKAISETEVKSIIHTASRRIKDRLLIELIYGLGGRVSEVVSLRVEDIDFDNSFIRIIKGKGNKERHNPIHSSCLELIKAYMRLYKISTGFLFPHKTDKSRHMTRVNAWDRVKKLAREAGVDPNKVSPHVFRHSFATHLLENGCDMAHVQEFLGHEDIATTRIYAHITKNNKKNTFNQFHPLASV